MEDTCSAAAAKQGPRDETPSPLTQCRSKTDMLQGRGGVYQNSGDVCNNGLSTMPEPNVHNAKEGQELVPALKKVYSPAGCAR